VPAAHTGLKYQSAYRLPAAAIACIVNIPRSRALSRSRKAAVGTSIVDGFDLDLNFRYRFSAFIAIGPLSAH